jgi:C-terminal processing protease CtpA/Prc
MRRSRFLLLSVFAAGVPGTTAVAQRDSIRARTVSLEAQVERLAKQLAAQRQLQDEMARVYVQLLAQTDSDGSQRTASIAAAKAMRERLMAGQNAQLVLSRQLQSLCTADTKPRGWLGVTLSGNVTVSRLGDGPDIFSFAAHPTLESVEPGSPAQKAGLRSGDVVVALSGRDIRVGDLIPAEVLQPGVRVPLKIRRAGATQVVMVRIEPRPESFQDAPCPWIDANVAVAMTPMPFPMPSRAPVGFVLAGPDSSERPASAIRFPARAPRAVAGTATPVVATPAPPVFYSGPFVDYFANGSGVVAGAQLVRMNHDLGQSFGGVEQGLLVISVLQGTAAEGSGLRAGDVLLTANEQDLTSPRVLQREIASAPEREVKLLIVRKGKKQTVSLHW